MNELYTVNTKGQMEINFESLEILTDGEFVETIQDDINAGYDVVAISIEESVIRVSTSLKYGTMVFVHYYYKDSKVMQSFSIPKDYLSDLVKGVQF